MGEEMASPMEVAVAGGHGKIGRRLGRLLIADGDRTRALIRKPEHAEDVRADGSEPVVCDLEHAGVDEISRAIAGADAVVFAAGAGPGSGPERKWSMDRDGAIKLLQAAQEAGVERYVMISAIGADDPPDDDQVFSIYLRAKAQADQALQESDRAWTIVRPGILNDDPGRGLVRISTAPFPTEVSRDDVAAILHGVLREPGSVRRILYVGSGDEPIEQALATQLGG
ncbi:MAG: SDR family oxidoreductase [Actinomycetota bacterium]